MTSTRAKHWVMFQLFYLVLRSVFAERLHEHHVTASLALNLGRLQCIRFCVNWKFSIQGIRIGKCSWVVEVQLVYSRNSIVKMVKKILFQFKAQPTSAFTKSPSDAPGALRQNFCTKGFSMVAELVLLQVTNK